MDYKDITFLTTQGLADRLKAESGCGNPAFNYGSLKALSQRDWPFVIRIQVRPGSKKPKVLFVYEWFKIWVLQGNDAVNSAIQECRPQIKEYLISLTKNPVGRPSELDQKTKNFLEVVGGGG
jgi:hypothetical protein